MADETRKADASHRPEFMLTTVDNPHNPFTAFDEWYAWDEHAGYNTPGMLARIANMSDDLAEVDQHLAIQQAIDEIVRENVLGVYKKVARVDATTSTE